MRASMKNGFMYTLLGGALVAAPDASAALTYPGCADLKAADFALETLNANATDKGTIEPMKMAFDMDASGNVSVYFTQRMGQLRKYDPIKKATVDIADLSKYPGFPTSFSGGSDGLLGIAMDPAFKANHWIYLDISTKTDWRVVRFTLNGDALDMASAKVLITIPQSPLSQHPGGALAFDGDGNLWITTGDNGKGWPSANTNDLRGKILRIKPTADGSYTIPAGNLFPPGTDKAKPEIYIMGNRNPYTITIDNKRKAVTWGDVGPDAGLLTEERDFVTKPGNHGWPMYAGNQVGQGKGAGTADKPINNDASNTGLSELPPAVPGFDSYKQSCAITGPVYYYDGANPSKVKMPPHFNGKWFVSDFNRFAVEALSLDDAGTKILARDPLFADIKLDRVTDFQVGPDGAFYFVNYAGYRDFTSKTGIVRIVYNGSCVSTAINAHAKPEWVERNVQVSGSSILVTVSGRHALQVRDLSGRLIAAYNGEGPAKYDIAGAMKAGVCVATLATGQGSFAWKMIR
jgi:cytochrome c